MVTDVYFHAADGIGSSPLLLTVVAGLLGVFGGGTIVTLIRVRADKQKIIVEAAQGAVIVQSSVIDDLNEELRRVREELIRAETRVKSCETEMINLHRENGELRHRIEVLEAENKAS